MRSIKIILLAIIILPFIFTGCCKDEATNSPPEILDLFAVPDTVIINDTSVVVCKSRDLNGDILTYIWDANGGTILGSGSTVSWIAPDIPNSYSIVCRVIDGNEGEDDEIINIVVTPPPLPTNGLIAFYPFNGNANDESGNNHHGNVNGATLTKDRFGNVNSAYHFDGSHFISVPDDTSFTLGTDAFSLSLWINLDKIDSYYIMGHDDGGGYTKKWIFWFTGTSLGLHERLNGEYWVILLDWNPKINNWYYLNLIRDGNIFSIYIDSILLGSTEDARAIPDPNSALLIGNAETANRMFQGKIDDVRFYNIALTTNEIETLYEEGG